MPAYSYSREFQRNVLRVIANDPTFLLGFRKAIEPDYFTNADDKVAAAAILKVFDESGSFPTVGTVLENVEDLCNSAQDADEIKDEIRLLYRDGLPTDAAVVRERVKEFGQRQRLKAVVLESQTYLDEGKLNEYEAAVREAITVAAEAGTISYDYFDRLEERLRAATQRAVLAIPTNIPTINAHLPDGGLGRGEMGILIGLPGYGKTTALVNFGMGALEAGHRVLHVTVGDLNERKVGQRYDAYMTGHDIAWCRMNVERVMEAVRAQMEARGGVDRLKIKYWPSNRVTVGEIEQYVRWLEARDGWKPDLIVVDYGQNIRSTQKYADDQRRMQHEEVYKDLRSMASAVNAALWTAQQANRGAFSSDGPPGMEEAAEAFGPMRDADIVIGIGASAQQRQDNLLLFRGAKVRDYDASWIERCQVDFATHTIRPIGDDNEAGHSLESHE